MMVMKDERIRTYVDGLDEAIGGGIPVSSSVLLVGGPGSGKTTLSTQFIYNGALHSEKGAIILIGQTREKFKNDMAKIGFDLKKLEKKGIVRIYELPVYDKKFDANFSNLVLELDSFGARRIVIDSFSVFFSSVATSEKHKEIIRMLKYLVEGSTLMLTLEKHSADINYPDEYFATDAVIDLGIPGVDGHDRKLKVLKMRQTDHSLSPFSFCISKGGIRVIKKPVLAHPKSVSYKRMKTGVETLDEALGGGFFNGTTILVAGNSGTGKTIMGLQFLLEGARQKNEKCLYISFEESDNEIKRNVSSIGWKLGGLIKKGKLDFFSAYPENKVPDELIEKIDNLICEGEYTRVVLDSITRLGQSMDDRSYLKFLKQVCATCRSKMATLMVLGEARGGDSISSVSEMEISSLVEGIILLKHVELLGEMRRSMMIVKMRGVNHDKKIKEFRIGNGGITIKGDLRKIESFIPAISDSLD